MKMEAPNMFRHFKHSYDTMSNVRYGLQDDRQTASKRNVELGRGGEAQSWKLTIISTFCNLTLFLIILTNML